MIFRAHRAAVAGLVALLAGCASTPPEADPVQIKLNDLDTRLTRIERVVANQSLLELANEVEALRSAVRSLRNEADQSGNKVTDLDQRLKSVESHGAAAPAAARADTESSSTAAPAVSDGYDRADYQTAFTLLKDSQYERAIAAFQKFLVSYPQSQLADNAWYWLGEAYYVTKSFPDALASFQRVVDKYPQSRKLPDALLKIGYCRYELQQWEGAKTVLAQVAAKFSDTPAGRLAQQRLDKMAAEKH